MESTAPPPTKLPTQITGLVELTRLLILHHALTEGRFKLAVGFRLAVGSVGRPEDSVPGAVIGVESVSLVKVPDDEQGPDIVDAAEVNGRPKPKAKALATKGPRR